MHHTDNPKSTSYNIWTIHICHLWIIQYQLKILFLHIHSTLPSIYMVNLLTITYKSNAAK